MSDTKHTPGPWIMDGPEDWEKVIRIENPGDGYARLYVEVCRDDCDTDVAEANARLIAASPDMLEALKQIAAWEFDFRGDCVADAQKVAREAIEKAEEK